MMCLLRSLKHIHINDKLPSEKNITLAANLSRIKHYRNMIVHSNDALVADKDFESYWNVVTKVIHNYITSLY